MSFDVRPYGSIFVACGDLVQYMENSRVPLQIVHGINSLCEHSGGFAKSMQEKFNISNSTGSGPLQLGESKTSFRQNDLGTDLIIHNLVTQLNPGPDATLYGVCRSLCNVTRSLIEGGQSIHMSLLGAGIGGLDPKEVIHNINDWVEIEGVTPAVFVWCFPKEFDAIFKGVE